MKTSKEKPMVPVPAKALPTRISQPGPPFSKEDEGRKQRDEDDQLRQRIDNDTLLIVNNAVLASLL